MIFRAVLITAVLAGCSPGQARHTAPPIFGCYSANDTAHNTFYLRFFESGAYLASVEGRTKSGTSEGEWQLAKGAIVLIPALSLDAIKGYNGPIVYSDNKLTLQGMGGTWASLKRIECPVAP